MSEPRRFSPLWRVVELEEAFRVEDAAGFAVAFTYFDRSPERRSSQGGMSKEEARCIAGWVAKVPSMQATIMGMEEECDDARAVATRGKCASILSLFGAGRRWRW